MAETPDTLKGVFGLGTPTLPRLPLSESGKCLSALRGCIPATASSAFWPAAMAQIHEQVGEALDVPIPSILGGAWSTYGPFLKYCDAKEYPSDVVSTVPLADHTIISSIKPYVEVYVGNERIGQLDFEIKLLITLEGGVLSIQNARFMSLRLASGKIEGMLSCEGVVVLDRTSKDYQFPGLILFGSGIPIVP